MGAFPRDKETSHTGLCAKTRAATFQASSTGGRFYLALVFCSSSSAASTSVLCLLGSTLVYTRTIFP